MPDSTKSQPSDSPTCPLDLDRDGLKDGRGGERKNEGGNKCALHNKTPFVIRMGKGQGDNFLKRSIRYEVTRLYRLPSVSGCLFERPRGQRK